MDVNILHCNSKGSFPLSDCDCDCDVANIRYIGVYVTIPTDVCDCDCDCDVGNTIARMGSVPIFCDCDCIIENNRQVATSIAVGMVIRFAKYLSQSQSLSGNEP